MVAKPKKRTYNKNAMKKKIKKDRQGRNPKSLANLRPVKKGGHAPPGAGHPKGVKNWSTVFREILALPLAEVEAFIGDELPERYRNRANQAIIAMKIMTKAMDGDLQAADRIMDRMDGKPKETVAMEQQDGVNLNDLPPELRREVLQEMLQECKKKGKGENYAK